MSDQDERGDGRPTSTLGEFSAGLAALDRLGLQPEVVTHSAETGIGYPGTRGDRSHLDVLLNDPRLGNVPAVSNADPTEGLFDLPEAPDVSEETDWDMMGGKGKGEVDFGSDDDPLADFPSYEATYEPPEADEPFDADNYSVKDLPVSEETLNRFKTLLHYRDDAAPADKEGNGPGYQGEMSSLVDKKLVPQWKMSEHIQLFPAFPTYHHLAENTDFSVQEKMQYLDQLKAFSDGGYKLILPDATQLGVTNLNSKRRAPSSFGAYARSTRPPSTTGQWRSQEGSITGDPYLGIQADTHAGVDQMSDDELGHFITSMYQLPVYGGGSLKSFNKLSAYGLDESKVPEDETEAYDKELEKFESLSLITEAQLTNKLKGHTSLREVMDADASREVRSQFLNSLTELCNESKQVILDNEENAAAWEQGRNEATVGDSD